MEGLLFKTIWLSIGGSALYGGLTHKEVAVEQKNFHSYRMIRIPEAPKKVEVHLSKMILAPLRPENLLLGSLEQCQTRYLSRHHL